MAAAWFVIVAAATLLAAGVMYSDAVARGGLLRVLLGASIAETAVDVSARVDGEAAETADRAVTAALDRALGTADITVSRAGRSESFEIAGAGAPASDLVVFAFAEAIDQHAALVAGSWPAPGADPMEVALSVPAATLLGVRAGDTVTVTSRLDAAVTLTARITGVFEPQDPAGLYWGDEPLATTGVVEGASFRTLGPLYVQREDLLERTVVQRAELTWHAVPALASIDTEDLPALRRGLGGLERRVRDALDEGTRIDVETDLGGLLGRAAAGLLVSGTGVLLLNVQLAVLAGYALLLVAGLIVDERRGETALFRSRGASGLQLGVLALMEGVLLVVPAVALGPFLAVAVVEVFNRIGPLAAVGLPLEPQVSGGAAALAGAGGLIALATLVAPTVAGGAALATIRRSVGRQIHRTVAHRFGFDVALLTLAGIGLWQLHQYGAPITRSLRGSLGADPLLVTAPAVGLLAGSVLALRLVPATAHVLERILARRRGLVAALGARQLARRPLRYTRSALLLIVASAIAFFAAGYARTWERSQRDQVDHQVAADVRVTSVAAPDTPAWGRAAAYRTLPGVEQAIPVFTEQFQVRASRERGTLLALDAAAAADVVTFRGDLADASFGELMNGLSATGSAVDLPTLPEGAERIALDVRVELEALEPGGRQVPGVWPGLSMAVVVRDAAGLVHRFRGVELPLAPADRRVEIVLGEEDDEEGAVPAHPLQLVAVEFNVRLPQALAATGRLELEAIEASNEPSADSWVPVADVADAPDWRYTRLDALSDPVLVPPSPAGAVAEIDDRNPIVGPDEVTFALRPGAIAAPESATLPALVNERLVAATGLQVGGAASVAAPFAEPRTLDVVGIIRGFPTLPADEPAAVVDIRSLALFEYARSGPTIDAHQWWLGVDEARRSAIVTSLQEHRFSADTVTDHAAALESRLRDPIALGVIGALSLGAVAGGLFAAIGFAVSAAVSVRERTTEFALFRALGLSRGQLAAWLSLETVFLLIVSLLAGIALGTVLAWVVLPTVALTPQGSPAVPPPLVTLPWDVAALLVGLGGVALAVAVPLLTRSLRRVTLGDVLRGGDE